MHPQSSRLFVYGSLRVGFRNPAYGYLTKYFHFLGEGIVKGRFYFNGYVPVAVPSEDEEKFITGDLYELNEPEDFDWVIVQLDDYEGLNVEAGERPLYKRELVTVLHNVQPAQAWIYWFNGSIDNMTELDAGEVAKYLQQQNKP
jgi:gamma-glutamylcyclotransferase (GGCT)/AIG2-like uncharacterized protein YtfP